MRASLFTIPFLALIAFPALAQQERPPEIIIGGAPQTNDSRQPGAGGTAAGRDGGRFERCVAVVIGSETSFSCLNERLRSQVDSVNPPVANIPPIDARSQDIKVGVANVPAVQQQYGRNFGVSAFPYRPPPPVYPSPLGGHR